MFAVDGCCCMQSTRVTREAEELRFFFLTLTLFLQESNVL